MVVFFIVFFDCCCIVVGVECIVEVEWLLVVVVEGFEFDVVCKFVVCVEVWFDLDGVELCVDE